MKLPDLNELTSNRNMLQVFRGLNKHLRVEEGEWNDECNLSGREYPVLTTRDKRGRYPFNFSAGASGDITAFIHNNMWLFIRGGKLYAEYPMGAECTKVTNDSFGNSSYMVSMGAYVVVFPEGYYVNTASVSVTDDVASFSETGYIEATFSGSVAITSNTDGDGNEIDVSTTTTAPTSPANGDMWYDATNKCIMIWSSAQDEWITSNDYFYVKITAAGITDHLTAGDTVTISSGTGAASVQTQYADRYEGERYIWQTGKNDENVPYIIIRHDEFKLIDGSGWKLDITRRMPKLDYVFECNNRLWGCHYGKTDSGEMLNEIYACKLGDFKNWYCLEGTAGDSYTASVGSQGMFTGGIVYGGYPVFFKENTIYKVYGAYPAAYQITTESIAGVAEGCGKSLAIVNDVLYYQGRHGIYAYTGGTPQKISDALGDEAPAVGIDEIISGFQQLPSSSAVTLALIVFVLARASIATGGIAASAVDSVLGTVAGVDNGCYYIDKFSKEKTLNADGSFNSIRLVYNPEQGIWHKENTAKAENTFTYNGSGYYAEQGAGTYLTTYRPNTLAPAADEEIEWYAESGVIGTDDPDRKYVSRLDFRMSLGLGATVMLFVQYDSQGDWQHVATLHRHNLQTFSLPVRLKRCDHYRMRVCGRGDCHIYSICKTVEGGSDRG